MVIAQGVKVVVDSREQQGLSSGHWLLVSQVWAQAVDARSDAKRIEAPRRTILNERMYSNAIDQTEVYILEKKEGSRERLQ